MDNKAQVSLEYLLILTAILAIVAVMVGLAGNLFDVKDNVLGNMGNYTEKVPEMI